MGYAALGHWFSVECSSSAVEAYISRILSALWIDSKVEESNYRVIETPGQWRLLYNDIELAQVPDPGVLVSCLLAHINRQVIARTKGMLLVHAGGVTDNGLGILLPAPTEAGKTTLVAGLLQRGFQYLSDEAVGIDLADVALHPYPKPLSVDPGSWKLFPELDPGHSGFGRFANGQWQIPPTAFAPDAIALRGQAGVIIQPQYREHALTSVTTMTRAETLAMLGECTFPTQLGHSEALRLLARLVERCDCYRLTIGHLDAACSLVQELVETARSRR